MSYRHPVEMILIRQLAREACRGALGARFDDVGPLEAGELAEISAIHYRRAWWRPAIHRDLVELLPGTDVVPGTSGLSLDV